MKKALSLTTCAFLLFSTFNLMAQDLIFTSEGDSLNCKITGQRDGFVYFNLSKDNPARDTLLAINKVTSVVKGYYEGSDIPKNIGIHSKREYSKLRFGFQVGYSLRTAITNNRSSSGVKTGIVAGADFHGFVSESLGLGLKYSINRYKGKKNGYSEDDIYLQYIAASILKRDITADRKNHFLMGINMGCQLYGGKAYAYGRDAEISGKTLGFGLEVGHEHKISNHSLLHFGFTFTAGTLKQISVNGAVQKLNKENYASLTRAELTVGLKFGN